ncbi:MAG: phosphoribosylanthranilate isomerase [Alphaproteobacteria bacterium]|nr:phosphoribosylanthranilate isomerase [Alphaproteobacteria bacterium]
MSDVKICGIKDQESLNTAIIAGARYIGFVFYPDSPRYIEPTEAKILSELTPKSARRIGLFVDPSNKQLEKISGIVPLDMIQLHGNETPSRVQEIKMLIKKPVIKALRIATKYDLENYEDYEAVADWLLFDSKSKASSQPGGTGQSFKWSILKDKTFSKPWMLSGGLTYENVTDALSILNPKVIDVSSGVESKKGVKDLDKIKNFINKVKSNG